MNERVVLITGGSSGIGEAIARDLGTDHKIVIASSNPARLAAGLERLRATIPNPSIHALQMDVVDEGSVEAAVKEALTVVGGIDVLINCAGVGGGGVTLDMTVQQWRRIVDVNLTGTFVVTRAVLQLGGMLTRGWGRIINIASTGGKQGVAFGAAYSASKHGVVGLTKSLGLELAKTGVTVNAVCPGFVETAMAAGARGRYARVWNCSIDEAKQRIEARVPLGRYVQPDEVTGLVRYLSSDASSAVLAQAFNVCGGLGNY